MFTHKHKYAGLLSIIFVMISFPVQSDQDFAAMGKQILIGTDAQRNAASDAFIERGGVDMVPTLVLLMRIGGSHVATQRALSALTGETLRTWREAMLYQEAHPEIIPHPSYYELKLWYWSGIDKDFLSLFSNPLERSKMRLSLIHIPSPRDRQKSRMPSSA